MTKQEQNTQKILSFVGEKFQNEEINNDSLVQLIELCGSYLNLQTISSYAKENKLSYNGVKKFRNTKEFFKVKFVMDND